VGVLRATKAGVSARLAALGPLQVALLSGAVAMVFVLARLLAAADGDVSRFVVAGDTFVDPAAVDPPIHVTPDSTGYDGQFFWRLAVDPASWDAAADHGVRIDANYRQPRIVYPVLAWVTAGGQAAWVEWSLVAVNVVAAGAVAGLAALLAVRGGKTPVHGLLLASTPGLLMALSRDLAELVTLAALLAGIVALQRGRWQLAALAWSTAVLSREQAMAAVAGYGLWRLVQLVRRQVRPGAADLPWLIPPLVGGAWQLVLWARIDELPLAAAGDQNAAVPFGDLVPAVVRWAQGDLARLEALAPVQLALAVALVIAAVWLGRARLAAEDSWLLWSLGLTTLLAVSLGRPVWDGPADLRQVADVFALSWAVLLLGSDRVPRALGGSAVAVWCATAAFRVLAI
jgi:hypothetical protein